MNLESNRLMVPPSSVATRREREELSFLRVVDLDYLALDYSGPLLLRIAENLANLLLILRMVSGSTSNRLASRAGEGEGEWLCSLTEIFYFDFDLEDAEYLSLSLSFRRLFRKVGMRWGCSFAVLGRSASLPGFWSLGGVTLILGGFMMFWECFKLCKNRGDRPLLLIFGLNINSITLDMILFLPFLISPQRHSPASNGIVIFATFPEEDLKQSPCGSASRKAASLAKLVKFSSLEARWGCGEKVVTCLSLTETMFLPLR